MDPDRIRGMLWGAVCGSALGLPLNGRDPHDHDHPAEYFKARPTTSHGKHPAGSWSGILEPLFLAIRAWVAQSAGGDAPGANPKAQLLDYLQAFAKELKSWAERGVSEWGDPASPYDLDYLTGSAVKIPGYVGAPMSCTSRDAPHSPNDCAALPRVLLAALMPTAEQAEQLAFVLCRATHRSTSVAATGCFIALTLQGALFRTSDRRQLMAYASERLGEYTQGPTHARLYRALKDRELQEVGGRDNSGRHVASLRCFMHAYRRVLAGGAPAAGIWEEVMAAVCGEGGAADVNGALAGAILGASYGLAAVPAWRAELPHADWVARIIEDIVRIVA